MWADNSYAVGGVARVKRQGTSSDGACGLQEDMSWL